MACMRRWIVLTAALVLCLWLVGVASATVIGPINYEWFQGETHKAKVEETFIPWQDLKTGDPTGANGWYKGDGINCWEYTVDVDPMLYVDIFGVNTHQITVEAAWNANGWNNPVLGVPLDRIEWTVGTGRLLDGETGMFRMWAQANRGIITGSLHIVDDGWGSGPVSGPEAPEPASLLLLGCGALGLVPMVRRRKLG